jgi:UDP-N-acetylmuramoyl-L-alanyl-D-glutamate--2,6-diaminopimelate ligase
VVAGDGHQRQDQRGELLPQIWMALGLRAVNLGTVGVEGAWEAPLRHTTPDPLTLHRVMRRRARRA